MNDNNRKLEPAFWRAAQAIATQYASQVAGRLDQAIVDGNVDPDFPAPLLDLDAVKLAIAEGVLIERERCAKIAEDTSTGANPYDFDQACELIATRIRSGE